MALTLSMEGNTLTHHTHPRPTFITQLKIHGLEVLTCQWEDMEMAAEACRQMKRATKPASLSLEVSMGKSFTGVTNCKIKKNFLNKKMIPVHENKPEIWYYIALGFINCSMKLRAREMDSSAIDCH